MLANVFCAANLLLFPSVFDTFGNVVLEAHACGLPVVAYGVKGPKDIVVHGKSGFLVDTPEEMAVRAIDILRDLRFAQYLRKGAVSCAASHQPVPILDALLRDVGLAAPTANAVNSVPEPPDAQDKAS